MARGRWEQAEYCKGLPADVARFIGVERQSVSRPVESCPTVDVHHKSLVVYLCKRHLASRLGFSVFGYYIRTSSVKVPQARLCIRMYD